MVVCAAKPTSLSTASRKNPPISVSILAEYSVRPDNEFANLSRRKEFLRLIPQGRFVPTIDDAGTLADPPEPECFYVPLMWVIDEGSNRGDLEDPAAPLAISPIVRCTRWHAERHRCRLKCR